MHSADGIQHRTTPMEYLGGHCNTKNKRFQNDSEGYWSIKHNLRVCKILWQVVRPYPHDNLLRNKLLLNSQHGLIKWWLRPVFYFDILIAPTLSYDKAVSDITVYLGTTKAYGPVIHNHLVSKIRPLPITHPMLLCSFSYPAGLNQVVEMDEHPSSPKPTLGDVIHGNAFDHLLFVLNTNDTFLSLNTVSLSFCQWHQAPSN